MMDEIFKHSNLIDNSNPTPRYIQLANSIRDAVRRGALASGDTLPSERSIVAATELSRVTVRKAIALLVEEGLLHQRHGSGTYIKVQDQRIEQSLGALTGFSEYMNSLGHVPSARWIEKRVSKPTNEEAMILNLSPGDQVVRLHRLRLADGEPLAVERALVPLHIVGDIEQIQDSLYETLQAKGMLPERALQRMQACHLPAFEADLMERQEGEPALYIERLSRSQSGGPIELTRSYYRGDRYDFLVELTLSGK